MYKYKWCSTGFPADADKVGQELERIEKDTQITNVSIVEFAKNNQDSELNKCFEWDNDVAGEKYRLIQANNIIQSISIVVKDTKPIQTTKAFVNIKTTEDKKVYKNIVDVVKNDEEYTQLIQKAEKEFVAYKEKYNNILKLKDLKDIILKNM